MSQKNADKGQDKLFAQFFKSALARSLASVFLCFILIESLFFALLLGSIVESERIAAKRYRILCALKERSELVDLMREHRLMIDNADRNPAQELSFQESSRLVKRKFQDARKSWSEAELAPELLERLIAACELVMQDGIAAGRSTNSSESQFFRQKAVDDTHKIYPQAMAQMELIEKALEKQRGLSVRNQSALTIVLLDLLVNFLFAALVAFWLQTKIANPIKQLAQNCEKLKEGVPLPEPIAIKNELDELESAFHQMSLQVQRNEQGRKAYIKILKDMQSARLIKIKESISLFSARNETALKKRIDMMNAGVTEMIRMLESMTDGLSFGTGGKVELESCRFQSSELLSMSASFVDSLLQKKAIRLELQASAGELIADQALLRRVLVNLLSNAIKFSARGSSVKLESCFKDDRFYCSVTDSGPGIAEADQKRLFQKFSQLNSEQKRSGSGLGLMICRQIIEAHGGKIGCISSDGSGSTFWFEIPVNAADVSESAGSSKSTGISKDASSGTAIENKSKRSKAGAGHGTLQSTFAGMLLVFFLTELAVLLFLAMKLNEAEITAQRYDRQQRLSVGIQKMFASFFTFGSVKSLERMGVEQAAACSPVLDELSKQVLNAQKDCKQDRSLLRKLKAIESRTKFMSNIVTEGVKTYSEIGIAELASTISTCKRKIREIEVLLFKVVQEQSELLDESYDLGAKLNSSLVVLISIAVAINLTLLCYLVFVAARILKRIQILAGKANDFAAGGSPVPSLKSKDELAYLDARLCEVVDEIRFAEAQRAELLAVINHDLRTPLGALLSNMELLQNELEQSDHKILTLIKEQELELKVLLEQVNNLLLLEKLENKSLRPDFSKIDLLDVLENLRLEGKKEGSWASNLVFDLNVSASNSVVQGELELLSIMFREVLKNACSASPAGSCVKVELSASRSHVKVKIIDQGKGIEREMQEQLFERFRSYRGEAISGIGLPLAQRLAQLHNGMLELESSDSNGSVVSVQLPCKNA